jgi:multidrug resistance efflux pump
MIKTTNKHTWLLAGTIALLIGVLVSGCGAIDNLTGDNGAQAQEPTLVPVIGDDLHLTTEGQLVPAREAWLSFEQTGPVTAILVAEGDVVSEGQVLARLGDRERLEAAITTAELERISAQGALDDLLLNAPLASSQAFLALVAAERRLIEAHQALDDLDTPDYQTDIDDALETVQEELDDLEEAQEEFDRYADLSEENSTRQRAEDDLEEAEISYADAVRALDRLQNDLEVARAEVADAEAALEDARHTYEERQDGPDPDDLALAQARLDNAMAGLASAEAALSNTELKAPFTGTVTSIDVTAGEIATAYLPVIQLADFTGWYVETSDLNEMDVVQINPDRPATVIPDALPELELEGEVDSIAQVYSERAGDVLYTVHIRLDESDPDLRWGMTVSVEFERK